MQPQLLYSFRMARNTYIYRAYPSYNTYKESWKNSLLIKSVLFASKMHAVFERCKKKSTLTLFKDKSKKITGYNCLYVNTLESK